MEGFKRKSVKLIQSLEFIKLNTFITKSYATLTYLKLLWISCCIAAFSLGMFLKIKRIDAHWTCMFTGEISPLQNWEHNILQTVFLYIFIMAILLKHFIR